PAGRHEQPHGVDVAPGRPGLTTDLGDLATLERHVAGVGRLARSIDYRATANDRIVHVRAPVGAAPDALANYRRSMSAPGAAPRQARSAVPGQRKVNGRSTAEAPKMPVQLVK